MTDVTDEMVRTGVEACARRIGCHGMSGNGYMCSDPLDDNCDCGKYVRAALEAAWPLMVDAERVRALLIVTKGYEDLCTDHQMLLLTRGNAIMNDSADTGGQ